MTFTLFVDTNIILDALLNRQPGATECQQIFLMAQNGAIDVYTSSDCIMTTIYFLKKYKLSNTNIVQLIEQILAILNLTSADRNSIKSGLHSGFNDLEDGVQYHIALKIKNVTHFITSNVRDFKKGNAQLPVLLPKEFINLYSKSQA